MTSAPQVSQPSDRQGVERFELARSDADALGERLGAHRVAVVLGSGWAATGDSLGPTLGRMAMTDLAGIPNPTVSGHSGSISSVEVEGPGGRPISTLILAGRSHLYEGHGVDTVVHAVRVAVLNGCRTVILTNAAGSLRPEVGVGSPVMISDQINLSGANPLCGQEPPVELGDRFTDLSSLYSRRLMDAVRAAYPDIPEGVYAGVLGGSYETPAEIRMLRTLGADLVGMSTVLEAIAACHLGAEVFGLSLVTNLAAGLQVDLNHADVLAAGHTASGQLAGIVATAIRAV